MAFSPCAAAPPPAACRQELLFTPLCVPAACASAGGLPAGDGDRSATADTTGPESGQVWGAYTGRATVGCPLSPAAALDSCMTSLLGRSQVSIRVRGHRGAPAVVWVLTRWRGTSTADQQRLSSTGSRWIRVFAGGGTGQAGRRIATGHNGCVPPQGLGTEALVRPWTLRWQQLSSRMVRWAAGLLMKRLGFRSQERCSACCAPSFAMCCAPYDSDVLRLISGRTCTVLARRW